MGKVKSVLRARGHLGVGKKVEFLALSVIGEQTQSTFSFNVKGRMDKIVFVLVIKRAS